MNFVANSIVSGGQSSMYGKRNRLVKVSIITNDIGLQTRLWCSDDDERGHWAEEAR